MTDQFWDKNRKYSVLLNRVLVSAFEQIAEDVAETINTVGHAAASVTAETGRKVDDSVTEVLRAEHVSLAQIQGLRVFGEGLGAGIAGDLP